MTTMSNESSAGTPALQRTWPTAQQYSRSVPIFMFARSLEQLQIASARQAPCFGGDASMFHLNAADEARSRLEPALRPNAAARIRSLEAARNSEVAGSNLRPATAKGAGNTPLPGHAGLCAAVPAACAQATLTQDLACGIEAGRAHHAASGVGGGAAQVQAAERRPVA